MFKNYLKIALRNLWRHKTYSFINVFGLAVGMACCILIFLYVRHELQHDRFHEHANDIFRLRIQETTPDGGSEFTTLFPATLSKAVAEELPGVIRASSFIRSLTQITYEEKYFGEHFALVGASFLQMFSFPLLAGDPATALSQPNNVVISENIARKLFGVSEGDYTQILGKVLRFQTFLTFPDQESQDFVVTGVMQNIPQTSSLQFDLLILIENWENYSIHHNWAGPATVYLQLAPGQDAGALEAAFPPFLEKNLANRIRIISPIKESFQLRLQPLTDVYLNRDVDSHYTEAGNAVYSYVLSAIAFLVLLIACVNFMTLSIGCSVSRATEVGMRKVLGAKRLQVMAQFWGEALLLCLFAMFLGIGLAEIFLPVFNKLAVKQLSISYFSNWETFLLLFGILLVTGLVAGSYPALVLSRFQPATVFRGQTLIGERSRVIRSLVVLQYVLSIALMVSTGVISQQLHYMRTKNLGYEKEQVVIVSVRNGVMAERYKNKLAQHNRIISAASSDRSFTSGAQIRDVKKDDGDWQTVRLIRIDPDYLETLGIDLIAGRNFTKTSTADVRQSVIVNETLVKTFGWATPIGKRLKGLRMGEGQHSPVIVGVVKDFHIDRLHRKIEPLVLHITPNFGGIYVVFVRIRADDIPGTIELLRKTWEETIPDEPFQYSFLDENLDLQYHNEKRWSQIAGYASTFAIVISCLGLLGLVSLAVTRRTKEIGIRKVLGATVANVVALLSKEFVKLVLLANVIAWPMAWYAMNRWLENFAYRINIEWWIFVLAGGLALLIALLTVSTQAVQAAVANPVEALRYE